MAFLTLAGTTVEVQVSGATESESLKIGEATRAFSGAYRSGVRAEKRTWIFTIVPGDQTALAALRTLVGPIDTPIVAAGDFNGGVSVTVVARIGATPYIQDGSVSFLRVATLTLIEV